MEDTRPSRSAQSRNNKNRKKKKRKRESVQSKLAEQEGKIEELKQKVAVSNHVTNIMEKRMRLAESKVPKTRPKLRLITSSVSKQPHNIASHMTVRKDNVAEVILAQPDTITIFDDSDIIRHHSIGTGQFGTVYASTITFMDSVVAQKILKEERPLKELETELKVGQLLSGHKNFPFVYGRTPKSIVMEFIGNKSTVTATLPLSTTLNELQEPDFIKITSELIHGVQHMHSIGILHNDIHYGNLIYNPSLSLLKIVDLGKASLICQPAIYRVPLSMQENYSKFHKHLAPELWKTQGTQQSVLTDIYSVGYAIKHMGGSKALSNFGRKLKSKFPDDRISLADARVLLSKEFLS